MGEANASDTLQLSSCASFASASGYGGLVKLFESGWGARKHEGPLKVRRKQSTREAATRHVSDEETNPARNNEHEMQSVALAARPARHDMTNIAFHFAKQLAHPMVACATKY